MIELYVGCKTKVPGAYKDMHYIIEVESHCYPSIDRRNELIDFLNENSSEIVDEVTHIIDKTTGELIWEVK